ncbi:MAG: aminotransferase class I/II-fold pyridoxal phosphate-dependent enzyme [Clostridiales bacterium]|mgnify:CR=1 FL=1|nr:aminotransferase class I/II-fold pyridoxal phosphate-dependent enzyme [Clostridiales bacterium]
MNRLYEKLIRYSKNDYYPMHMPGHKRNTLLLPAGNPYSIDITEIPGFDNLNQPEEILKELSGRISKLYGSAHAFPMVNGSTVGILAGISAATNPGDRVLVARNCHKSVYHTIALRQLKPIYIYPQRVDDSPINGGISPENMEALLIKHPDIKLIIITSPTYEGVVSDIERIVDIAHKYGAILLVDEAHGAHMGFHKEFPKSAITYGADIVIHSLHKTLPAFTQTAILHSNLPKLNQRIQKFISIYQSSSPSYVLMAGIDRCIHLLEEKSETLFCSYYQKLQHFFQMIEKLKHLRLLTGEVIGKYGIHDFDPSKITIITSETPFNGHQLSEILLEKYHVVMEMESRDYILGITSIGDTQEGLDRFAKALLEIDQQIENRCDEKDYKVIDTLVLTPSISKMYPYEAMEHETEVVPLKESCGKVCADIVSQYPPGTPLLVPGEVIEDDLIIFIQQAINDGFTITGLIGDQKDRIEVIKE